MAISMTCLILYIGIKSFMVAAQRKNSFKITTSTFAGTTTNIQKFIVTSATVIIYMSVTSFKKL